MTTAATLVAIVCCGAYLARRLSRRLSRLERRVLLIEEGTVKAPQDVAMGVDLTDRLASFQRMKFSPNLVVKK